MAQPGSVHAAYSYDSCTGFIDSLPATITTQGTWCLRKHLSTGITGGQAIQVAANNVTIECNGFRIGGLAAGSASETVGIFADERQNLAVRNCQIRGFREGIRISEGAGHVVEDNRLDNNLVFGVMTANTSNTRVARNLVFDTGGHSTAAWVKGIYADADIVDNTVSGVFATVASASLRGIESYASGNQIRGNAISGLDMASGGSVIGIESYGQYVRYSGNHVVGGTGSDIKGMGIYARSPLSVCIRNSVGGFANNITQNCRVSGNLLMVP